MKHRLPDWPERLAACLEEHRRLPFHAVQNNCALMVCTTIAAITGRDAPDELGIEIPASEKGVARVLIEHGGVRGLAEEFFGVPPDEVVCRARRGDLMIKDGTEGETLGVCVGDHALFLSEDGLQRRELAECKGFWHVG